MTFGTIAEGPRPAQDGDRNQYAGRTRLVPLRGHVIPMNLGELNVWPQGLRRTLERFGLIEAISKAEAKFGGPLVLFGSEAKDKVYRYVSGQPQESGGLLLGIPAAVERVAASYLICVSDAIPSERYKNSKVSLKMHSSIWSLARQRQQEGLQVMGWFHSHPGIGAYFSGTDLATQRQFFSHEYSLGYVIDPVYNDDAFFLGPDSLPVCKGAVLIIPDMMPIISSLLLP